MSNADWAHDAFHTQEEGASARQAETPQSSGNEAGMEALLAENDYAFHSLRRGETVEGTVVRVDQDEVLVDVGMKSEGVIPARELYGESDGVPPLQVGDRTLVYVLNPEGGDGHAILSLRKAQMERSWREIEEAYQQGAILDAPVVDFNKGGLIVDVKGVRGFVPVSQVLDLRNITRQEGENEEVNQTLSQMSGRRLPLKIIEINRVRNRLILSERAAVQEQRASRKDELMDQLVPGQIRRGVVSNVTSFGAFVDLGGADGLVHVSELSYNRVNHPSEILRVGQEIEVAVLSIDRDTKKIALSLKRALPDPWTTVDQRYHLGQVVPVTITKLAKFGAFAKVEEGLEGLIHLTELSDRAVQDASQVVQEGQPVDAKIIQINSQRRRLGLSVRQAANYSRAEVQSFGEIDYTSPFATEAMSAYDPYTPLPDDELTPPIEPSVPVEQATPMTEDFERNNTTEASTGFEADEMLPSTSAETEPAQELTDTSLTMPAADVVAESAIPDVPELQTPTEADSPPSAVESAPETAEAVPPSPTHGPEAEARESDSPHIDLEPESPMPEVTDVAAADAQDISPVPAEASNEDIDDSTSGSTPATSHSAR